MNHSLEKICIQAQHNCHIADALHGGDYTMCAYLLKIREFFSLGAGFGFPGLFAHRKSGKLAHEREMLLDLAREYWMALAEDMLSLHETLGSQAAPAIKELVEQRCGVQAHV